MKKLPAVFSRKTFLLICALLILITAGCTSSTTIGFPYWQNQDLRYIDPIDASTPNSDLIAVEIKSSKPSLLSPQGELYLRLDFLARSISSSDSIFIFFDTSPGGTNQHPLIGTMSLAWEFYLVIRSNQVQVYNQQHQILSGVQVAVFHQIDQDYLEIAIHTSKRNFFIPDDGRIQIFVISNSSKQVLDRSDPIAISALPPAPVKVIFVFWDTYSATTPAQALRRWDGAHTGPLGARHGLYNLLRAAQAQNIPFVLLDLKKPISLSALDFSGKLSSILPMAALNQIILPDNLPMDYPFYHSIDTNFLNHFYQHTLDEFGFSKSPFLFLNFPINNPNDVKLANYAALFALSEDTNSIVQNRRFGSNWLFEIPHGISSPAYQPSDDGLAIELKKEIISAAIENNQGKPNIIAIGGDLPRTTWGDYQIARNALETITQLPWVQVMNAQDLLSWKRTTAPMIAMEPLTANSTTLGFLPTLHSPELTLSRNLFLDTLFPFDRPTNWYKLQNNLTKLLPAYTFVDDWMQQPHPISACPVDISGDGQKDCILANQMLFLWIDPANGGILFVYENKNGQLHQIIAPGFTLTNGQTDPSQWDFSKGIYIEKRPDNIALQDEPPYPLFEIGENSIIFRDISGVDHLQNHRTKLIQIKQNQLEIIYNHPVGHLLTIPLNLDPWHRFEKGWVNNYKICQTNSFNSGNTLCLSYQSDHSSSNLIVQVTAVTPVNHDLSPKQTISLSMDTFKDTLSRFSRTEDPNQDKPFGHFLPFPMSLIRIFPPDHGPLEITITISNEE